jgi:hypothetical protein
MCGGQCVCTCDHSTQGDTAVSQRARPQPRHATPRHATPRHATPRHATPRRTTPRHATPRQAAPRHAAPSPAGAPQWSSLAAQRWPPAGPAASSAWRGTQHARGTRTGSGGRPGGRWGEGGGQACIMHAHGCIRCGAPASMHGGVRAAAGDNQWLPPPRAGLGQLTDNSGGLDPPHTCSAADSCVRTAVRLSAPATPHTSPTRT